MSDESPWGELADPPDIDAYRTLTIRYWHVADYTEVEADGTEHPMMGTLDLIKIARRIADDPDWAQWAMKRGIPSRRQEAFGKVVRFLDWLYRAARGREPTLEELTRDLSDLFPEMPRDEMFDRLHSVADEEAHA